jgi:hypothetical protein
MISAPPTFWKVYTGKAGRPTAILADYYNIDNGVITLRNRNPTGGYPIVVAAFAHGSWTRIVNGGLLDLSGNFRSAK